MLRRLIFLLIFTQLVGCAMQTRFKNHEALASNDVAYASSEAAAYIASVLPAASSTVWITITQPKPHLEQSEFTAAAIDTLRASGFAVAEDNAATTGAHSVRLLATTLNDGMFLTIDIDGNSAARWYERDMNGVLIPASAFTVRAAQ